MEWSTREKINSYFFAQFTCCWCFVYKQEFKKKKTLKSGNEWEQCQWMNGKQLEVLHVKWCCIVNKKKNVFSKQCWKFDIFYKNFNRFFYSREGLHDDNLSKNILANNHQRDQENVFFVVTQQSHKIIFIICV